mgnify:CR=1 FL=1
MKNILSILLFLISLISNSQVIRYWDMNSVSYISLNQYFTLDTTQSDTMMVYDGELEQCGISGSKFLVSIPSSPGYYKILFWNYGKLTFGDSLNFWNDDTLEWSINEINIRVDSPYSKFITSYIVDGTPTSLFIDDEIVGEFEINFIEDKLIINNFVIISDDYNLGQSYYTNECISLSTNSYFLSSNILIYPNPTSDMINISELSNISVVDPIGRSKYYINVRSIDLELSGVYIIMIGNKKFKAIRD